MLQLAGAIDARLTPSVAFFSGIDLGHTFDDFLTVEQIGAGGRTVGATVGVRFEL